MPFHLSRGGANVAAEVQRWQYFLRRRGFDDTGIIDGSFGPKTEGATRRYQSAAGLAADGRVGTCTLAAARGHGYRIVADDHYPRLARPDFPPRPAGFASPSNASRNRDFGCFIFHQPPRDARADAEAIVPGGGCDGGPADWTAANIVEIAVPQLRFARAYPGRVRCHRLAAAKIRALFAAWEAADLMHLVLSWEGCFAARYKRGQAPAGIAGHGPRPSAATAALSNHAFGTAFDINAADNPMGRTPPPAGERGAVRELVEAAHAAGFYWGGHFGTPDGMHFELAVP